MADVGAGSRPRVMVVDDHPRILRAATVLLSQSCDVVASLADGVSAIDAAPRLRPDVIVLDIEMPGLNGFETCTRILASGSDARILFLSNHDGEDVVLATLTRGATGFVSKLRMSLDLVNAVGHAYAGREFVPTATLLPRWHRPHRGRHAVQMHVGDTALLDAVGAYFDSALEAGHPIIGVMTGPYRREIERRLSDRGHDVSALAAANRYQTCDATAAANTVVQNGRFEGSWFLESFDAAVTRALQSAGSAAHVCVFGQVAAILHARGFVDEMLQLEQMRDDFVAPKPVTVLCSCATRLQRSDGTDLVASVCAAHSTIVPAGKEVYASAGGTAAFPS